MSKKFKLEDCLPDDKNFNKHTQRGMGLLEKSVGEVGVIESVTVSADNKVITGNARQEVMVQKFEGVQPIIVETDGTKPVIIKRTDIKSGTKQFHKAALLANTVSKHNVNLDLDLIQEVAVDELEIDVVDLGMYEMEISDNEAREDNESENPYTKKIEAPLYDIKGECPSIGELFDLTRYNHLVNQIEGSAIDKEIKQFLLIAATRHIVFDYQKIAEFYAAADSEVQNLMESSALIIIDFDKAIENGYVELSEKIEAEYKTEE